MEVLVTFDKLTVIIGVVSSLALQEYLEEPGRTVTVGPVTLKGSTIWRRLERAQAIDLNNPEIYGMLSMFLDAETKQKVDDYVAAQSVVAQPPAAGSQFAYRYRVPLPGQSAMPQGPLAWVCQFNTAECSAWVEGGYIIVETDGNCTAPGVEVL